MKLPTARCLLLAFALSGSALGQAPIEVPVIPPPVEIAVDPASESEGEDMEEPDANLVSVGLGIHAPRLYEFTGDEIDLVIRTLARQGGMNVVLSDNALKSGNLTMRIENKSPKEALEVVVQAKGLFMEEYNGVYFVKSGEDVFKEPTSRTLERTTDTLVGPLSRLKGEYYRQLLESGVPEATASTLVLNEELSRALLVPPIRSPQNEMRQTPETQTDPLKWFAWTALGSIGLDFLQRLPVILLNIVLALAVWFTARRARRAGTELFYFSPFFWGLATLIGGVFVAALYWVMHHSSLRPAANTM